MPAYALIDLQPRRMQLALMAGLAAAGVLLSHYSPMQYSFYPPCPIHALTGWQCPGCGATRALAALVHGQFSHAFALNPLFCAVLLPGFILWLISSYARGSWVRMPSGLIYAFAALSVAFTVWRNIS